MKIHHELELIFKYRITANESLPNYILRMSRYGKLDLAHQVGLFALLFEKIDELEKLSGNAGNKQVKAATIDSKPRLEQKVDTTTKMDETPLKTESMASEVFLCTVCFKELKSRIGLAGHSRSHTKKVV